QEAEDVRAAELAVLQFLGGLAVDARHGEVRAQAIEREEHGGERQLLANVGDGERAEDRRQHRSTTGYASSVSAVPPAASMASRAAAEKPWARTVSFFDSVPLASTLTGTPLRVARPLPASASGVTSSLASKRSSR